MRIFLLVAVAGLAFPATSIAETLTIDVDDGVRLIRCLDLFGDAQCDLITNTDSAFKSCVALDANDTPIATTSVVSGITSAIFPQMDPTSIARILCQ